jgi:hypothetical protein
MKDQVQCQSNGGRCDGRAAGVETLVYRIASAKALLAGYHINSTECITN